MLKGIHDKLRVSIHAPARGATSTRHDVGAFFGVSIHAPARGATFGMATKCRHFGCFNPRPRAGGDQSAYSPRATLGCFNPRPRAGGDLRIRWLRPRNVVSIHAPARGATKHPGVGFYRDRFQSTPPRGGRPRRTNAARHIVLFQSTPPRGGRRSAPAGPAPECLVSIHAPARGATRSARQPGRHGKFQSTPPRGGRPLTGHVFDYNGLFQSTPPRGGRPPKNSALFGAALRR